MPIDYDKVETAVEGIITEATKVYKFMLPKQVEFVLGLGEGKGKDKDGVCLDLEGLDDEGRPIYRSLPGSQSRSQLVWQENTDKRKGRWEAKVSGSTFFLPGCALPWDQGTWCREDGDGGPGQGAPASCIRKDAPKLSRTEAEALQSCFAPGGCNGSVTFAARKALERSGLGEHVIHQDGEQAETLLQVLVKLLQHMCSATSLIFPEEAGTPKSPAGKDWGSVWASLRSLAPFADKPVTDKLRPLGGDKTALYTRCMIYNCRLLDMCDIRCPSEPCLLRVFHHVLLRRWQTVHSSDVRYVDREKRSVRHTRVPPKDQKVRLVIVSDTHGWDSEMMLPDGDVLLHCGDLLFESSGCPAEALATPEDLEVPKDLERALERLHRPAFSRYRWIFIVGGNHDQSLQDMWTSNHDGLCRMLPPNVVFLEAAAQQLFSTNETWAAKDKKGMRKKILQGAVWLNPDLTLEKPDNRKGEGFHRKGWMIAGTGLSLAKNMWSANSAFQLEQTNRSQRVNAVKRLLEFGPHIVMTHGPPSFSGKDEKNCDNILAEQLDSCKTVCLHVYGHEHAERAVEFGERCSINAAVSTELYVAARPPFVVDLDRENSNFSASTHHAEAVRPSEMEVDGCGQDWFDVCFGDPADLAQQPSSGRGSHGSRPGLQALLLSDTAATDTVSVLEAPVSVDVANEQIALKQHKHRDFAQKWVSDSAQAPLLKEMLAEVEATPGEMGRLTMFDVAGPATCWARLSLVGCVVSAAYPWLAWCFSYCHAGQQGQQAVVASYPWELWVPVPPFIMFILWVELKVLQFVSVVQVQWVGRFPFLGVCYFIEFRSWLVVQAILSIMNRVDVAASSLFFAKALASSHCGLGSRWARANPWLFQAEHAFLLWYSVRVLQLFYILASVLPLEPVSYGFRSMHSGYRVFMSYMWAPINVGAHMAGRPMKHYKIWHADALETLATFGGLNAVTNQSLLLARKRAEHEKKDICRCLHILCMELQHLVMSFLFQRVLDALAKLELQVAFAASLLNQGEQGALDFLLKDWQLHVALASSLLTALMAFAGDLRSWASLYCAISEAAAVAREKADLQAQRNARLTWIWMALYGCLLLVMCTVLIHVLWRLRDTYWKALHAVPLTS